MKKLLFAAAVAAIAWFFITGQWQTGQSPTKNNYAVVTHECLGWRIGFATAQLERTATKDTIPGSRLFTVLFVPENQWQACQRDPATDNMW